MSTFQQLSVTTACFPHRLIGFEGVLINPRDISPNPPAKPALLPAEVKKREAASPREPFANRDSGDAEAGAAPGTKVTGYRLQQA